MRWQGGSGEVAVAALLAPTLSLGQLPLDIMANKYLLQAEQSVMEFVWIPAGEFLMGSTSEEARSW